MIAFGSQDLPYMAQTTLTPPTRSQNPHPLNTPFAIPQNAKVLDGAEIGLLSFSPPPAIDPELKSRRARFTRVQNLNSDFQNKLQFGDITPRAFRTPTS